MAVEIDSKELRLNIRKMVAKKIFSLEDQEDLTQEIMLKIIKYANLKDPGPFFSWLRLTVRSTVGDFYRKSPTNHFSLENSHLVAPENEREIENDLTECIRPFLKKMEISEANLIEEIDLNGVSQKEFSEKMNINYSTLKSRIKKARQTLGVKISQCCANSDKICC